MMLMIFAVEGGTYALVVWRYCRTIIEPSLAKAYVYWATRREAHALHSPMASSNKDAGSGTSAATWLVMMLSPVIN